MYVNKEKQDKPCNIQRVSKPFSVFTMSSHNMSGYEH